MKDVIRGAVETLRQGRPCVLATVVRTKGSTPQKAGAMLLVRDDGSGLGTLGGGCVEGDIWFAAQEMLRQQTGPEFKDYYLNEDIAARDGLVCGGTMYFYLEPLRQPNDFLPLGDEILEAYDGGEPVSLATLVNSPHHPENQGAKLLLRADGNISGTLGHPDLDQPAIEAAQRIAHLGNTESLTTQDGAEIFVEGFTTPPTLIMVGGGHVGKATADLAHQLGYRVQIVDDRPEFSNPDRFLYAEQTIVTPYHHWQDHLTINVNTFIVVATRGHRYDDLALESALQTRARYIGLLGSRRKTLMIYQRLMQQGTPQDRIRQIHAPVGLNIGALTPEELAVSIMSEIIMTRRSAPGGQLKMSDWYINRAATQATRHNPPNPDHAADLDSVPADHTDGIADAVAIAGHAARADITDAVGIADHAPGITGTVGIADHAPGITGHAASADIADHAAGAGIADAADITGHAPAITAAAGSPAPAASADIVHAPGITAPAAGADVADAPGTAGHALGITAAGSPAHTASTDIAAAPGTAGHAANTAHPDRPIEV